MPSSYTSNYQLNQWARADKVLMDDFNADNAKIDGAIRAVDARADALAGSKADVSALEAEVNARTAADEALSATLSSHAQTMTRLGNCQIETFTYTGNGKSGLDMTAVTFPRMPVFAVIVDPGGDYLPLWPGTPKSRYSCHDEPVNTTWSGRTVSLSAVSSQYQMNSNASVYRVIALYARDA